MTPSLKNDIWRQFGASIDMLENAIKLCPQTVWTSASNFWYITYHCLFWLDYYLSVNPADFSPPSPYTLSEFNPSGEMPDQVYSQEEMLSYLKHCRNKCYMLIENFTEEMASARWINEHKDYSMFEMLLYNMRHVQHHTAQLNLILRQEIDDAPPWVSIARNGLVR